VLADLRIVLEEGEEIALAPPDRHGVALYQTIGVLPRGAFLGEGQHHSLRMHEPTEAVEVLLHVVRVDDELVD
jgi:hypothetical protein